MKKYLRYWSRGGRAVGGPLRLAENRHIAFQGCTALGRGFVLDKPEAQFWIDEDPTNAEVLFPYMNGDDLNSRFDVSASRWVIDFNDRSIEQARAYELPFRRLESTVRLERAKSNRKVYRDYWWKFAERRPAMRKAVGGLDEFLAIAITSKSLMPVRIRADQVVSNAISVFALNSFSDQAVLSSSVHQMWALKYGSGMRNDPRYTPSDVFETFPRPGIWSELEVLGRVLHQDRQEIMGRRKFGITKLYNIINDPDVADSDDADIRHMRNLHSSLDRAVLMAYGWGDIALEHGFHTYRQMKRWTVCPLGRVEILERLLEENQRRAAAQGDVPLPTEDVLEEQYA